MSRLQENRSELLGRVESCLRDLGRDPTAVRIVAVTKEVPAPLAAELLCLGSLDLGENRADGLEEKRRWFDGQGLRARWHFVGHLQRNKARRVLCLADEIHSVDSLELLETLQRIAAEEGRFPGVYLQVKLVDEPTKSGLDPRQLPELLARAEAGPLPLLGLMTIAPLVDDPAAARSAARDVFQRAAALARQLPGSAFQGGRARLSMGMTQDFEEALAAGADVLRIGSAFFEGVEAPAEGSARNGR